jgi:hypothetical protein
MPDSKTKLGEDAEKREERPTLKELLLAPEPRWDMPLPRHRKLRRREAPNFTDETDAGPSKLALTRSALPRRLDLSRFAGEVITSPAPAAARARSAARR